MDGARRLDTRVRVEGWRYPRHFFVTDDVIAMEICRTACSHCPTCQSRMNLVSERIRNTGHTYGFRHVGGGNYLWVKPKEMPGNPYAFFSKLLKLCIG